MATPTTLPAVAVAGEVLTASYVNNLRGAFRVLQVVSGSTTTNPGANNTNVMEDTGLTVTITPSSSSSKILIFVSQNGGYKSGANSGSAVTCKLLRGGTDISFFGVEVGFNGVAEELILASMSTMVLDVPATTSAITYKTKFANRVNAAGVQVQLNAALSTIIACEISA